MTKNKNKSTCRICLKLPKKRSKFISVHNNYRHSKENQTFAELFQQTTGFHIEACEPQFLCTDCRLKLIKCFQFIQQCKNTQENLRSLTASTANHREIKIYYEEEIFLDAAPYNETYDQNFECNEIANEPGELIVEHDVPEATVAPYTPGINEPDEQSSICSDSRNETEEITIEEPKLATNANDSETNAELIVEHVVAENIEVPGTRGIEEVSVAEPTILENDLKLKECEFVCIVGSDPIENVTESQDLKATDNRFACDQCPKSSCVFESKKKLIAHKYRVHKKTVRCSSCKKYFRPNHFERHKIFCSLIFKNKRTTNSMKRLRRYHLEHEIKFQKSSKSTVKIKRVARKKSNRASPTSESCEIEKPNPNACRDINESDSPQTQHLVIRLEPMRKGYFCDYCKENSCFYKSKSALLTHMSTHLLKSPCRFCNEDYTLGEIDTHKAKCKLNPKSKNDLSCKLCKDSSFVFKHKESLHKHIKRKHTNVNYVLCTDCGRSFSSDYVKQHIESVHTKIIKFICDLCPDKTFTVKNNLIHHMKFNHLKNPKPIICKICGEGYRTSDLLEIHRRKKHTDLYPLYKCSHCSYKTLYKDSFRIHRKRHLGDAGKKHKCKTCGKKFITKGQLNTHLASHSNQNSFICDICGQGFTAILYLKRHLHRVHLGEKRFECPVCNKKFQKNQDNRSHIEKHHPEYELPPPGTVLKKNSKVKMSKVTKINDR